MKQEDIIKLNKEVKDSFVVQANSYLKKEWDKNKYKFIIDCCLMSLVLFIGTLDIKLASTCNTLAIILGCIIVSVGIFWCIINVLKNIKYNKLAKKYNVTKLELINNIN